jgi:hypothetical protein
VFRFESGNLERAVKITEAYYELHIRSANGSPNRKYGIYEILRHNKVTLLNRIVIVSTESIALISM